MEETVAIAKVWGVIMVGFFTPASVEQAPFIDVNYQTMGECEVVRAELLERFPDGRIWCTPTYKPESAPRKKRVVRRTRTVRR